MVPAVAINIVRFNQPYELLERCLNVALNQDGVDFTVTLSENGSKDSIESAVLARFASHPRFRYVDNGANLGFAGAHNRFFFHADADFLMPLNPDTVMTRDYLIRLVKAFDEPRIGAAEGKMLKPDPRADGSWVLDGTGMTLSRARRAHERGQMEIDRGQYDNETAVFGVSGTAPLYRKAALEKVKHFRSEYFDEDFFTYWEDLDLSWRLQLAGFSCVYVPDAIIYHSRFAGQSQHGIRKLPEFVAHTRGIPTRILRWDWRNHLFAIIKNDFGSSFWRDLPYMATREATLLAYFSIFEPRALGAIPEFIRLLPSVLRKRRMIQQQRAVTSEEIGQWFGKDEGQR